MSETKHCEACQATDSVKFRSLGGEMWRRAVKNGLVKKEWKEGICLCNACYMNVKNPLDKILKQAKSTENVVATCEEEEKSTKIELSEAIKILARILYERKHVRHEGPIYSFDEMRQLFEEIQPSLKDFFYQLYLAARPLEHNSDNGSYEKLNVIYLFSSCIVK
ncbi:hypothetical protein C2G38_324754 [Gigaspora rosea]|uniref:Uncharacterized protein n=1 Tax=Gigaspora rosea TaxID=44941 RepID=A0A397UEJ6_9GLOM|nr:hypothetical protein C2G38_324754 [Gigaspora rosea]